VAQAKELRMQNSPDGCSRIGLPEGWTITGTQEGAVSAEGPDGAVDLGCFAQVWDSRYPPGMFQPPLMAAYSTPAQALQELMPQISRVSEQMSGRGQRFVRLMGEHPFSWPLGQAATLDYEFDRLEGGRAERWHSLTNIYMSPNPDGTWTVVWSGVGAPSARFGEGIPTLLAIFDSWQVSKGVLAGRMDKARKSLSDAAEIYRAGIANTQRTSERAADDWDDRIREVTLLRDEDTGEVYEVPTDQVDPLRRRLNEMEGRFRYEVINRLQMP
jgi:hypothetical protein